MITPYAKLTSDGYVLCLPGQVKLDAGKLGSYLSALKVTLRNECLIKRATAFTEAVLLLKFSN